MNKRQRKKLRLKGYSKHDRRAFHQLRVRVRSSLVEFSGRKATPQTIELARARVIEETQKMFDELRDNHDRKMLAAFGVPRDVLYPQEVPIILEPPRGPREAFIVRHGMLDRSRKPSCLIIGDPLA